VLEVLKPKAAINWSPVQNLHITCKFIGAWPEDRLAHLKDALSTISSTGPIPIAISGFGFFPNPHHPHSLFAGVHSGPALSELAEAIDQALTPLGCRPETRAFHPHVTLARIKRTSDLRSLREHMAAVPGVEFGSFHAREFHLYLSQPAARGSVYTKLATYDLVRE
jgi:2'-5' RNA ligase